MKRVLLIQVALFLLINTSLFSQVYQLPNGGFETWDGTGSDDEPTNWNGFPSAACDLPFPASLGCGSATETRHAKSTDIRPGSTGSYSIKLFATSVLGTMANGTVTTGQIRIGSSTAASTENYNITRTGDAQFRQAIDAKPDSLVFWAKFVCPSTTQTAKLSAIIHDNYSYRDPDGSDANAESHAVAKATHYFTRGDQGWIRYSVPFDYSHPATDETYLLITFTTNSINGVGSTSDNLYVDDVELVYNTKLSDLKVNGISITEFSSSVYDYYVDAECESTVNVSAIAQSPNASVNIVQSSGGTPATVTITSGNSTDVYHVYFNFTHVETIEDAICQGESYNLHGFSLPVQNTAGTFSHQQTIYSSEACDSIVNLNLTVNPVYTDAPIDVMICGDGEYNFHGTLLSEEGYYETTLTSISGCDSTVSLNLTVGSFFQSEIFAAICDGEYYTENNFNTNIAGLDTITYLAQNGCDSLVILDLTINPVFETNIEDSTTVGIAYIGNGFTLDVIETVGTYNFELNLSSEYGCDSTIFLTLLVKDIPEDTTPIPSGNFTLTIFPIPANEELTVKSDSQVTYEVNYTIYDLFGKKTMAGKIINDETVIDISSLAAGIYFMKIICKSKHYTVFKLLIN